MYGFNPLTPLELLPLPTDKIIDFDGQKRAEFVKKLHAKVQAHIERKNEQYAKQANKGRVKVVFKPGDWVWVHLRKERFASLQKSKLQPRGDGPFQVLERINDNAYKIDLPNSYGNVSTTFNVADLSLFDVGDSRTNPSQEGGNDGDQVTSHQDPLQGIGSPMTRARAKKMKEALQGLVMEIKEKEGQQEALQSLIAENAAAHGQVPPQRYQFTQTMFNLRTESVAARTIETPRRDTNAAAHII